MFDCMDSITFIKLLKKSIILVTVQYLYNSLYLTLVNLNLLVKIHLKAKMFNKIGVFSTH